MQDSPTPRSNRPRSNGRGSDSKRSPRSSDTGGRSNYSQTLPRLELPSSESTPRQVRLWLNAAEQRIRAMDLDPETATGFRLAFEYAQTWKHCEVIREKLREVRQ